MEIESPKLKALKRAAEDGSSLLLEGLWDGPKAYLLSLLRSRPLLLISEESKDNRLQSNLPFFGVNFLEFPSWQTLPGEEEAPSIDLVGQRMQTLYQLTEEKHPLLIAPLSACLQKIPRKKSLLPLFHQIKAESRMAFASLPQLFHSLGYTKVALITDKGQFAVRGGIIDIFPISTTEPYRIEFFDDHVEQIRSFDVSSQRSKERVKELLISPADERQLQGEETLFDYLKKDTLIIFDDPAHLEDKWVTFTGKPPHYLTIDELWEKIQPFAVHYWLKERAEELSENVKAEKIGRAFYSGKEVLQPLSFELFNREIHTNRCQHPFREIADAFSFEENRAAATKEEILEKVSRTKGLTLHFVTASKSEEEALKRCLPQPFPPARYVQGYLASGFYVEDAHFAYLPMTELTHQYKIRRQKWRSSSHTPIHEFHELMCGDLVVHFHQGIAKYLGIEKHRNHIGQEEEFFVLEFSENSKLFVPLSSSHLISRYIGNVETLPSLSTLGSKRWENTRQKAESAIVGYAHDLIRMQAMREVEGGFSFPEPGPLVDAFEQEFPYVETEDQKRAIHDIFSFMHSGTAMDHLLCGDVGYGKTEVAMRAAFLAVCEGKKQVALLVPTTLLALQHYETFLARLANFPITIAHLSRFSTAKENRETVKKILDGKVDIVIGTLRMISKDVSFHNLGLIIIDEEQRFGVRAKERLKAMKAGVDCLALSATPIPRTLYLSLIGARTISIINTPPQDRLPIKTILAEREPALIQNALLRELSRDGQAFFLHNRIETIFQTKEELQKLLPAAKILVAHGQMDPDEIDALFHAFKQGHADILISTTIIENGIDIPNAGTILIDRADQFGLADLYQMRGRVGRWNKHSFAYFLTPPKRALAPLVHKRLMALVESSGHGGGMKLALRDLEIRGSGDILGTQQSGQIAAIGFHLYCKLLKRAVDALKKQKPLSFLDTKIEFPYPASLPESYIGESSLRMEIYHRFGAAENEEEIKALLLELQDRFGAPPLEVEWLVAMSAIRIEASTHHFLSLKFEKSTVTAERKSEKKVLLLPRTKEPKHFAELIITQLKKSFSL